jgi:hypothetical protein
MEAHESGNANLMENKAVLGIAAIPRNERSDGYEVCCHHCIEGIHVSIENRYSKLSWRVRRAKRLRYKHLWLALYKKMQVIAVIKRRSSKFPSDISTIACDVLTETCDDKHLNNDPKGSRYGATDAALIAFLIHQLKRILPLKPS